MTEKRTLGVRDFACPEPAEMVLEAVSTLTDGQYLEVIHFQEPRLLYPQLQKRGFSFLVRKDDAPLIKVLVWRLQDAAAKHAVDAAVD